MQTDILFDVPEIRSVMEGALIGIPIQVLEPVIDNRVFMAYAPQVTFEMLSSTRSMSAPLCLGKLCTQMQCQPLT